MEYEDLSEQERGKLIDDITDWQDDPKDIASFTEAIDTIKELQRSNAELERELADIKESYRNVLAEPCEYDDRVHCTCVPALRAENERLRKALKTAFNHECKFYDCRRMSGKVSDGYCYVHQKIYSAVEANNAKST